jgi:hypothetical protein
LFFAIKLKQRQRALKLLRSKICEDLLNLKSVESVVMPLVDYTLFRGDKQKENRRNTISYDKD